MYYSLLVWYSVVSQFSVPIAQCMSHCPSCPMPWISPTLATHVSCDIRSSTSHVMRAASKGQEINSNTTQSFLTNTQCEAVSAHTQACQLQYKPHHMYTTLLCLSLSVHMGPQSVILTTLVGREQFVPHSSIFLKVSSPSMIRPNTTWKPSNHSASPNVTKN